jgi:hypothetical protein
VGFSHNVFGSIAAAYKINPLDSGKFEFKAVPPVAEVYQLTLVVFNTKSLIVGTSIAQKL